MITLLNKSYLYTTFGVEDFTALENSVQNMAPSMVEYYLSDMSSSSDNEYLNKRDIQQTLNLGEYSLYLDYNDNIYLEIDISSFEDETQSLW